MEEAVERSSLVEIPSSLYPQQVGDISEGMAEADHKILSAEVHGIIYFFPLYECSTFHLTQTCC